MVVIACVCNYVHKERSSTLHCEIMAKVVDETELYPSKCHLMLSILFKYD